ncbi:cupin-like domain-containing protein [Halioxenophilus aromaticivorans]|uniref:Cupin-like domain-containing protein n=1 Tax=Halioxenophilus aromaticivorans TaxID=1306992 RepID=A0AAV3U9R9_9ALTE
MAQAARELHGVDPNDIPYQQLFDANEPVILKGVVGHWPMVQAGLASTRSGMDFLLQNYNGKPATVYVGEPEIEARFAYNEQCTGFNFRAETVTLNDVFSRIANGMGTQSHPYYYINSLLLNEAFPSIDSSNSLAFNHPEFASSKQIAKVWIGTQSRASAHYDIPKNIACCVMGRRRFTLFPPSQVSNLYPGPLSPTPGGQVITMVDLKAPDYDKFPRFKQAEQHAVIADMEPGDALYYPSMWWHEVEAKDAFNVMVNYWWINAPRYMGNPLDVLMHAMLELRGRSDAEKAAWRELFDYYIFGDEAQVTEHLPEACQGLLAELDDNTARRLRAQLQRSLNR